jgi:hypothetical protein
MSFKTRLGWFLTHERERIISEAVADCPKMP